MTCLIKPDMHHTCLCIMPWLCLLVYHVVCFFPVLLLLVSSSNVAFVRVHSTSSICLLHGIVLLPSGISGKMTVTLNLITIIAMLVASMLSLCHVTYHLLIMPHMLLNQASNPPCPSKPLFGYVTALLSSSYSVVSCRWSWRLLHDGQDYVGISQYLLFNLMHLYTL